MKKAFLIISLIFIASVLTAQTQIGDSNSPIYHKNGNVGIGTINSYNSLLYVHSVNSDFYTTKIQNKNPLGHGLAVIAASDSTNSFIVQDYVGKTNFIVKGNGNVSIGTFNNNGSKLLVLSNTPEVYTTKIQNSNALGHGLAIIGASQSTNSLIVQDYAGKTNLIVKGDGNIGIGTVTPSHKLSVNGTIRAKEIIVDNNNWPDYVIEADYDLKDLSEVQDFINNNGHLPDVPSAKMVHENGVSLAELNATLLQKVEELTLYIIKQQEQMDDQQEQIDQLKSNLQ